MGSRSISNYGIKDSTRIEKKRAILKPTNKQLMKKRNELNNNIN